MQGKEILPPTSAPSNEVAAPQKWESEEEKMRRTQKQDHFELQKKKMVAFALEKNPCFSLPYFFLSLPLPCFSVSSSPLFFLCLCLSFFFLSLSLSLSLSIFLYFSLFLFFPLSSPIFLSLASFQNFRCNLDPILCVFPTGHARYAEDWGGGFFKSEREGRENCGSKLVHVLFFFFCWCYKVVIVTVWRLVLFCVMIFLSVDVIHSFGWS